MQFGTAQSYFSSVEKKIAPDSPTWNYQAMAKGAGALPAPPPGEVTIPTWKDELYFEHHRGTYTTQANQKRNMRDSEEWMLNAEKYSSLAWLDGKSYPTTELNEAWKKVLFNQFHDLAAGSGIGVIYKDAQRDYDQVHWATNEVSTKALGTIEARIEHARRWSCAGGGLQSSGMGTLRTGQCRCANAGGNCQRSFRSGCKRSRAALGNHFERQPDEYLPPAGARRTIFPRSAMRCCMWCRASGPLPAISKRAE